MLVVSEIPFCELTVTQDDTLLLDFTVIIGTEIELDVNVNPVGPQGIQGEQGEVSASSIGQLADVMLTNVQDGDLLVYQSSKFINAPQSIITDGGNF